MLVNIEDYPEEYLEAKEDRLALEEQLINEF
jgi:hypothetical protein